MPRNLDELNASHRRNRLEARYYSLKQQIALMNGQRSLSPEEQLLVANLKREKLAMKDELAQLG